MVLAVKEIEGGTLGVPVAESQWSDAKAVPPLPAKAPFRPRRVSVVDIDELGNWLVGRLREKFPQHSDRVLYSWLRSCTNDNECFFSRDADAVAMATVHRSFLEPPWVKEVFCLAKTEDDKLHATGLYTDIRTWAVGLGAAHIIVEQFSDVDRADISLEIGTPKREVRSVVYLPQRLP